MKTQFYVGQKVFDEGVQEEGVVHSICYTLKYPVKVYFQDKGYRTYTLDGEFLHGNERIRLYPVDSIEKPFFEVDDIVSDIRFGRGKVVHVTKHHNGFPVRVLFDSGKSVNYCPDGKGAEDHLEPILKLVERKEKCKFRVGDEVISLSSGPGIVKDIMQNCIYVSFFSYTEAYTKEGRLKTSHYYPTLFLLSENPTLNEIIGRTE